jgi:hypothetical protein
MNVTRAMPRPRTLLPLGAALAVFAVPAVGHAKPFAPEIFCTVAYPGEQPCAVAPPPCTYCHQTTTQPVVMNPYGEAVAGAMAQYVTPPFVGKDELFKQALPKALADVEPLDSDGDGHTNIDEITWGSLPGHPKSTPSELGCPDPEILAGRDYLVCLYDPRYVYRKVGIDFCGLPPSFEELEAFVALDEAARKTALHDKLDACLASEFWRGRDGVLWRLAHRKVRPVGALHGFASYCYDYELFVYSQTDGRDVRELLTAQYLVQRLPDGAPPPGKYLPSCAYENEPPGAKSVYEKVAARTDQFVQPRRRVGMMLTAWTLLYNTMFTALPRTTAAQAYRAFLGLDIARGQGIDDGYAVAGEPVDYDDKGVGAAGCVVCHRVLDPLSYPFATYNGLQSPLFSYDPNRIQQFVAQYPKMASMPESGWLFGAPVADLLAWAAAAADHDQFFRATAADYWRLLLGSEPDAVPSLQPTFEALAEGLRISRSVEAMLHALVDTEAYGAP